MLRYCSVRPFTQSSLVITRSRTQIESGSTYNFAVVQKSRPLESTPRQPCSKRLQVAVWRTRRRFLGTWYADIGDRMEAVRGKRWFVMQRAPGTEPRCAEKVRYSWRGRPSQTARFAADLRAAAAVSTAAGPLYGPGSQRHRAGVGRPEENAEGSLRPARRGGPTHPLPGDGGRPDSEPIRKRSERRGAPAQRLPDVA
jgi:hypothetical protein